MLKQKKSIIGLDLGSSSIKAVEITRDKFDYVITAFEQIDIPQFLPFLLHFALQRRERKGVQMNTCGANALTDTKQQ